jgi:hypothetical protein
MGIINDGAVSSYNGAYIQYNDIRNNFLADLTWVESFKFENRLARV